MSKKSRRVNVEGYPGVAYELVPSKADPNKLEKSYIIRYRWEGREIEERCGRESRPDLMTPARAYAERKLILAGEQKPKRIRDAESKKAKASTVNAIWQNYLNAKISEKGGMVHSLVTDNSRYKRWIKKLIGKKRISDVSQWHINRIRQDMQKEGKAPGTIKHVMELVRRISNYTIGQGLEGLPFKVKVPDVKNLKTEDLTPDQVAALIKHCKAETINPDIARLMLLALYTGLRRGELLKLTWSDVDFQRGFIYPKNRKGGTDQKVRINSLIQEVLGRQPRYKGSDLIFPNPATLQRRVDIRKTVKRIWKAAKLPEGHRPLHSLRHHHATMLASHGVSDRHLMAALGHSDPKMIKRYTHVRDKALEDIAAISENFYKSANDND